MNKLIYNSYRKNILEEISKKPRSFTYLRDKIGKSAGNTSHHINVLEKNGLIEKEEAKTKKGYKRGKEVIIKLNKNKWEKYQNKAKKEWEKFCNKIKENTQPSYKEDDEINNGGKS